MNKENTKELYVLSVYTENRMGILNRITGVLSRRRLNVESLVVEASPEEGIHRCQFRIYMGKEQARLVAEQLDKLVDVVAVFFLPVEEVIARHLLVFSLRFEPENRSDLYNLLTNERLHMLTEEKNQLLAEMTGTHEEITVLLQKVKSFAVVLSSGTSSLWFSKEEAACLSLNAELN
jgi:acetolactate synthase-1/3 small subunit